jgi:CRISPR-associated endonuclease/helicase Cas3
MRASAFGAEDCAAIAGLLHDLGKAKPAFQAYIRGAGPHEPHAGAGALFYSLPRTSSGAMR